jgi:hypothetical protein
MQQHQQVEHEIGGLLGQAVVIARDRGQRGFDALLAELLGGCATPPAASRAT